MPCNTGGSLCSKGKTLLAALCSTTRVPSATVSAAEERLQLAQAGILQVTNPWRNLDAERSHFISSIFLFINRSGSKALLSEKSAFAFVCFSLFNLGKSQQLRTERLVAVPEAAMLIASASQWRAKEHEPSKALTKRAFKPKCSWASMTLAKMSFGLGLTG